jgi:hypothetical protein
MIGMCRRPNNPDETPPLWNPKKCTHPGCLQRQPEESNYIKCLGCGAILVKIIPGTENAVSESHPVKVYMDEVELLDE